MIFFRHSFFRTVFNVITYFTLTKKQSVGNTIHKSVSITTHHAQIVKTDRTHAMFQGTRNTYATFLNIYHINYIVHVY